MDSDDAPTEPLSEVPTELAGEPAEPLSAARCQNCAADRHLWGKRVTELVELAQPGGHTGWHWIGLTRAACVCRDCAETCKAAIVTVDLTHKDISMTAPTAMITPPTAAPDAVPQFPPEGPTYEILKKLRDALRRL